MVTDSNGQVPETCEAAVELRSRTNSAHEKMLALEQVMSAAEAEGKTMIVTD